MILWQHSYYSGFLSTFQIGSKTLLYVQEYQAGLQLCLGEFN